MKKEKFDSQNWDDDFDRVKKRKGSTKNSEYKRKEKYRKNYFSDDY
jgi:hypothetical protein